MKKLVVGILAHVDAGKTTLSEALLLESGRIKKAGRVDNRDSFLDNHKLERARGITIFSKQAVFPAGGWEITLLDTPGHVDFAGETERILQVLDYAVLVINGADGVQSHTKTLWKLLSGHRIPVFLFVNKMDRPGTDRAGLLADIRRQLDDNCIDLSHGLQGDAVLEEAAVCDEAALEQFLKTGEIRKDTLCAMIRKRKLFPCYFGSALRAEGVKELLGGLSGYAVEPAYPEKFGARVFKIGRDPQGSRLTWLKVTGGALRVKDMPEGCQDKIGQIRIYSGSKFETVNEAGPGTVCAVTGPKNTRSGQGLGWEKNGETPELEPVMTYQVLPPEGCDCHTLLEQLCQLEEEEPLLHILWNEQLNQIHVRLMGPVQAEILKSLAEERFGLKIDFGPGSVAYRETILEPVEGVGHFEPLRHYAEVHLYMEPGEAGSGLVLASKVSKDVLDLNWQRLILSNLTDRIHRGVLTGSPITDMKITLVAGRAHLKHTEGGDFQQAAWRAVRQGLKKAKSVLLEPWYDFTLEVPAGTVGRAMADIRKMGGSFEAPETRGDTAVLTGIVPVASLGDYQLEVAAYTKGSGKLFCAVRGYAPCHNQEEVVKAIGYDPERDLEQPTGSVFCTNGAGYAVPWDEVERHMHLESWLKPVKEEKALKPSQSAVPRDGLDMDKELEGIFERTYGPVKQRTGEQRKVYTGEEQEKSPGKEERVSQEEYLLVDGYNIIFSWGELKKLSKVSVEMARYKLMDILCDYQSYRKCTVILVFDAYKVEGFPGEMVKYNNIYVVYTKEAETADQYIEKMVHKIGHSSRVTVATSDQLEQVIILGQGGRRLSARGLKEEIKLANQRVRSAYQSEGTGNKNYLFQGTDEETARLLERMRLGKDG